MNTDYNQMIQILRSELVPSTGCTEPSVIAYAASLAKDTLGEIPDRVFVNLSGNVIKNAQSVVVPNTGGLIGIKAATAAGIVAGDSQAKLDVLSKIKTSDVQCIKRFLARECITIHHKNTSALLDVEVVVYNKDESAKVCITHTHQNVSAIYRNDKIIYKNDEYTPENAEQNDGLSVDSIVRFADNVNLDLVRELLSEQLTCNSSLCEEGLQNSYGVSLGKMLFSIAQSPETKAIAYTVSGIDARMGGSNLPAIICCGSGNQGITASAPLLFLRAELEIDEERLYRALIVSNLITVHIKKGIGCLSAYCGAIIAGTSVCAAIAYMTNCSTKVIEDTITNSLAMASGTVCDGAKASCASKVHIALEAGFTALELAKRGVRFHAGDGIIKNEVENTIRAIGRLGKAGMAQTDVEILSIMLDDQAALAG